MRKPNLFVAFEKRVLTVRKKRFLLLLEKNSSKLILHESRKVVEEQKAVLDNLVM